MPTDIPLPATESVRENRKLFWLAILLAAILQTVIIFRSPVIAKDGMTFINIARDMTRSPVAAIRAADQHAGYPVLILAGRKLAALFTSKQGVHLWIAGARLAPWLCGVLCVLVVWLLTRRIFDVRIAGVAAVLLACLPAFRENAADALSDAPHLLFYLLGVWLACEGVVRQRLLWFAGAGAASGIAYSIRPEGLSVALVTAVFLAIIWVRRKGMSRRLSLLGII